MVAILFMFNTVCAPPFILFPLSLLFTDESSPGGTADADAAEMNNCRNCPSSRPPRTTRRPVTNHHMFTDVVHFFALGIYVLDRRLFLSLNAKRTLIRLYIMMCYPCYNIYSEYTISVLASPSTSYRRMFMLKKNGRWMITGKTLRSVELQLWVYPTRYTQVMSRIIVYEQQRNLTRRRYSI